VDDRRSYTGGEIVVASLHITSHLASMSQMGTVGLMLPTSGMFGPCALSVWSLGKAVVPLNYLLKHEELQYVIDDCGTDTIISSRQMLEFMGFSPRVRNMVLLEDLKFEGVPEVRRPTGAEDEDLAVLLYTSGTSGKPKGVILSHGNLGANLKQVKEHVHITRQDIMLGVLPQFHSFGMTVLTLLPLTLGLKAVYTARFVPSKLLRLIREHRPTIFVAIPSMYSALLNLKDAEPEDFQSIRYAISGGEPLPLNVSERFRERFALTIAEGYGLTETSPATNLCLTEEFRPSAVGRPLPGMQQRIMDINSGAVLGPNEDGEIQMKGPNIMQGYFKLPAETAAVFTPDGYFKTCDIGRFDDEGFLYITGRLKEMIIVGGENVFPREIEEALNSHESIAASGVIGMNDPVRGELPVAFVELREGATFDEAAVVSHLRQRIAGYKIPRDIRVVASLPRNPTGKIVRRELKKLL
jgi:long-chain acyl-CoA synthetase